MGPGAAATGRGSSYLIAGLATKENGQTTRRPPPDVKTG